MESNNLITNSQCSFRKQRFTMDHVVILGTSIRETNTQEHHLMTAFFDLKKAYKTTWKFSIMKNQHSLRLRLPNFSRSFLSDCKFRVRVESTFSYFYKQEQGVLQESIRSVTLFNLKINNITKCLSPGLKTSVSLPHQNTCAKQSVNSSNAPRK